MFLLEQVRFVCMSDTHSLTPHIKFDIPDGDVFIHAGDFTRCGGEEEVVNFSNWIGESLKFYLNFKELQRL